jgi:hypothetical protein
VCWLKERRQIEDRQSDAAFSAVAQAGSGLTCTLSVPNSSVLYYPQAWWYHWTALQLTFSHTHGRSCWQAICIDRTNKYTGSEWMWQHHSNSYLCSRMASSSLALSTSCSIIRGLFSCSCNAADNHFLGRPKWSNDVHFLSEKDIILLKNGVLDWIMYIKIRWSKVTLSSLQTNNINRGESTCTRSAWGMRQHASSIGRRDTGITSVIPHFYIV